MGVHRANTADTIQSGNSDTRRPIFSHLPVCYIFEGVKADIFVY
jgi:hypothetical protein